MLKIKCVQNRCDQTFNTFYSFRRHLQKVHPVDKSTNTLLQPLIDSCLEMQEENYMPQNESISNELLITKKTEDVTIENLKMRALSFSLSLYQQNNLPRSLAAELQNLVSDLLSSISTAIEGVLNKIELKEDFKVLLNFCQNPFEEIKTEYRLFKILKELKLYQDPKVFLIRNDISEVVVNGNPTLGPKSANIYIMPLQFIFQKIFQTPKLLDYTLENTKTFLEGNIYNNFASGELFKSKVQQLQGNLVIPYNIYFDDFQINNPLGSHTYSICGCYLNFPSMPQYLLSKLEYIFLLLSYRLKI